MKSDSFEPNTTNQQAGSQEGPEPGGPLLGIAGHTDGHTDGPQVAPQRVVGRWLAGSPGETRLVLPHRVGTFSPPFAFLGLLPDDFWGTSEVMLGTNDLTFHFLGNKLYLSVSANTDFLLTRFLLRDYTGSLQIPRLTVH